MYEQILKTIGDVARENGYAIVLYKESASQPSKNTPELLQQIERRKVLHCDESVDLTALVLGRLNTSYSGK